MWTIERLVCTLRQYRDGRKPEAENMPYSHFELLSAQHIVPQAALHTPCL